ncbi:MAG: hypothetical protein K0U72_15985 [Gammaproteobacteria bacterium]|nr:hypothetical protein [Gammaproteobacteria bacterium]
MKSLSDIVKEQHGERPPQDDALTDRLFGEIMRLAEEICVLQDRLDTAQQLSQAGRSADNASIDAFEVDESLLRKRLARHQVFISEMFERLKTV